MKDADEGEGSTAPNGIVGAPPGKATNNLPEPWDNHGAKLCNVLYTDAHVESLGLKQASALGEFSSRMAGGTSA